MRCRLAVAVVLLFLQSAAPAQNGRRGRAPRFRPSAVAGLRTGYDFDAEAWSLGGQLRLPIGGLRTGLQIIPSGDLYFQNGGTDWQLNLDAAVRLLMFYGGAGLAYLNRDLQPIGENGGRSGINVFIGSPLPLPLWRYGLQPCVEARWTDVDQIRLFRLVLGVNFVVRRRR